MSSDFLIELLELVLELNIFDKDLELCIQESGAAKGTILAPNLATLSLTKRFDNAQWKMKWTRHTFTTLEMLKYKLKDFMGGICYICYIFWIAVVCCTLQTSKSKSALFTFFASFCKILIQIRRKMRQKGKFGVYSKMLVDTKMLVLAQRKSRHNNKKDDHCII